MTERASLKLVALRAEFETRLAISTYFSCEYLECDIGTVVTVMNAVIYTSELLGMAAEEFTVFLEKARNGEMAIVIDYEDDDPNYVVIVFEDGLEAHGIHKLTLAVCELI
ncbi:MAG: hypothetical protein PHI31_06470 [Desulfuromonadaceae bacterium]|nr:hypothetical protein [Desulfuromonadaceae bacterium]